MNYSEIADEAVSEYDAMQKAPELAELLEFLSKRDISNVLEIGGNYGGTMWAWSHIVKSPHKMVCIDLQILDGRMTRAKDVDYKLFILDSQEEDTYLKVREEFCGDNVDFLFIDGDHHYSFVRHDYDAYRKLVKPGGVIALHDTRHPSGGGYEMQRMWEEMKADYSNHFEIYYSQQYYWGGIGVVIC